MPVLLLGGLLAASFAWAGVYLLWSPGDWPGLGLGETVGSVVGLRPVWGWLLLLACGTWVALRGRPARPNALPHPEEDPAR